MENIVKQHIFQKFDQIKKSRFSIKTPEPQIKQKNPRSSEKTPSVADHFDMRKFITVL